MTDKEIEKIAELLFKKLIDFQNEFDNKPENISFHVYDDFGNSNTVDELTFFKYELDRLKDLENKYIENENYEKAAIIKNKLDKIKIKINKLNNN
jgi:hypothetical protein